MERVGGVGNADGLPPVPGRGVDPGLGTDEVMVHHSRSRPRWSCARPRDREGQTDVWSECRRYRRRE